MEEKELTEEQKLAQKQKNEADTLAFMEKHQARLEMWVSHHGKAIPPIANAGDNIVWLNRETRRKLAKSK